jgi:ribosome recycling factor
MNTYIMAEIDSAQKKMSGYIALMNYRFKNLCVKADPISLLPVTVYVGMNEYNMEDVANVNKPNEFQLGVYPKDPDNLQTIMQGIYEAHPEFKIEQKSTKGDQATDDDAGSLFLLLTMPEVDNNRRDILNNGVKGLREECQARIDTIYADQKAFFVELLVNSKPEEVEEANKALKEAYKQCTDIVDDLLFNKQDEIEEAYQRYLEEKERQKLGEINNFDYSQGMRLGQDE